MRFWFQTVRKLDYNLSPAYACDTFLKILNGEKFKMKTLQNILNQAPVLLLGLLLMACDSPSDQDSRNIETPPVGQLGISDDLEKQLPFTCSTEKSVISPRDVDADKLFQHANWRHRKSPSKKDPEEFREIERLYRIAAAWGHDKAANNLAHMLMQTGNYKKLHDRVVSEASSMMMNNGIPMHRAYGYANMWTDILIKPDDLYESDSSDYDTKPAEIVEDLIRRDIPDGYFLKGLILESGYGSVKQDSKASLQYFRKAADLGVLDAQHLLGGELRNEIGKEMQHCAANQGHTKAAFRIAESFEEEKKYDEAVKHYQIAVKMGSARAANRLQQAFEYSVIGLARDEERANRYEKIEKILDGYEYATVDEIDKIVPLPPAALPKWDEQIEWIKKLEKSEAPPLPNEKRINEMALKKGLDPKTGWLLKEEDTK